MKRNIVILTDKDEVAFVKNVTIKAGTYSDFLEDFKKYEGLDFDLLQIELLENAADCAIGEGIAAPIEITPFKGLALSFMPFVRANCSDLSSILTSTYKPSAAAKKVAQKYYIQHVFNVKKQVFSKQLQHGKTNEETAIMKLYQTLGIDLDITDEQQARVENAYLKGYTDLLTTLNGEKVIVDTKCPDNLLYGFINSNPDDDELQALGYLDILYPIGYTKSIIVKSCMPYSPDRLEKEKRSMAYHIKDEEELETAQKELQNQNDLVTEILDKNPAALIKKKIFEYNGEVIKKIYEQVEQMNKYFYIELRKQYFTDYNFTNQNKF